MFFHLRKGMETMSSFDHTTLPNALRSGGITIAPLILLPIFAMSLSLLARADDLTGLPVDDPKDLLPNPAARTTFCPSNGEVLFVPMPSWARGVTMPPLPDQLTPMGKKSAAATAPVPAPLAPPKDVSPISTTNGVETTMAGGKAPASVGSPAMITVSPFLQWIKANPQAAAIQARQQAGNYHTGPLSPNAIPGGPGGPTGGGENASDDSYWLPPLIDSSDIGTKSVGGSAAIYSTPQR
jgi:hypothetical protein